jgi:hypothetical protein
VSATLVSGVVLFSGLAAANALPTGAQRVASSVLAGLGLNVPTPDASTHSTGPDDPSTPGNGAELSHDGGVPAVHGQSDIAGVNSGLSTAGGQATIPSGSTPPATASGGTSAPSGGTSRQAPTTTTRPRTDGERRHSGDD